MKREKRVVLPEHKDRDYFSFGKSADKRRKRNNAA